MNSGSEHIQRQYIQQVRRALADMPQMRSRLLDSLESSTEEYLNAHPDASLRDLYAEYGDPQQVASNALQEAGTQEVLLRLRRARRMRWAMAIVIVLLSVVVTFFVATGGVMVVTTERTYISYPADMTDEEIYAAAEAAMERHLQEIQAAEKGK